jgi:hypothetical protein
MRRIFKLTSIGFLILTAISCSSSDGKRDEVVFNGPFDGSVAQVEDYLKENLKDPDSYEGIDWSKVVKEDGNDYSFMVRHKYRAKNGFGGYVVENKVFYLSATGRVVKVVDFE